MAFAILLAVAAGIALILVLARYAKAPAVLRKEHRDRHPHVWVKPMMAPERLLEIVLELLPAMGLHVIEAEPLGHPGAMRIVAISRGAPRGARHIIYVEATPPGQEVDAPMLLELAEDVTYGDAALGIIVTPYEIDRSVVAGLRADLELIDGNALLALVERHLPERAAEMRSYHLGDGTRRSPKRPARTSSAAGALS